MGVTRNDIQAISASNSVFSTGTVRITGGPNITVGTDASGISISGANPGAGGGVAIQASDSTYSTGTAVLSGSNGVVVSYNAGTVLISGPTVGGAQTGISSVGNSQTTYTSGAVQLLGSQAVTVRSTTGQGFVIDAPAQTAQTGISSIAASNTTYTSGSVLFTGSNAATVRSTTGQAVVIDVPTGASATGNFGAVAAAGNTYTSGTVVLSGGANVSVGTNGQTITISAAAGGGGNFSAGVSNLGNTAGSTGVSGSNLVLVGSQNVSLSQSTDANGATVSFSAPAGGGGGNFSMGVSTGGNTAGDTGVTGSRVVLVGMSGVSLSQTTDANGATISVLAPQHVGDDFVRLPAQSASAVAGVAGSNTLFPLKYDDGPMDFAISANTIRMFVSIAGSSNRSSAGSTTFRLGVFTNNAGTLSLLNSGSMSYGHTLASSNVSTMWNGVKQIDFESSAWSAQPVFSEGREYYLLLQYTSSSQSNPMSVMGMSNNTVYSGTLGASTWATTGGNKPADWMGMFNATTTAMPVSIQKSQVSVTGAGFMPSPQMVILG